jgi:phospholipase C
MNPVEPKQIAQRRALSDGIVAGRVAAEAGMDAGAQMRAQLNIAPASAQVQQFRRVAVASTRMRMRVGTDRILGTGLGDATPFRRIVVIVRENRTPDNYVGRCPIPGADLDATLPNAVPRDPNAIWPTHGSASHEARDFWAPREQYSEAQVPFIWEWAREYGVYDRFFSETASPSTPGHLWMLTGNDGGLLNNHYGGAIGDAVKYIRRFNQPGLADQPAPPFPFPTVPGMLTKHGITWKNYGGAFLESFTETKGSPNTVPAWQFFYDALRGELPAVSLLYSPTFNLNEHSPDNVAAGIQYAGSALGAIVLGCLDHGIPWESFLCVNIHDDSGGCYDHVRAPHTEMWPYDERIAWRHGQRVMMQAISAWSPGGVVSTPMSHCSLPRALMDLMGEEPFQYRSGGHDLGYRDGEATSILAGLDFTQNRKDPPITTEGRLKQSLGRRLGCPGEVVAPAAGLSHAALNQTVPALTSDDRHTMRTRAQHFAALRPSKLPGLNF